MKIFKQEESKEDQYFWSYTDLYFSPWFSKQPKSSVFVSRGHLPVFLSI